MATSTRCARTLLGPAKRTKISTPASCTKTFSRAKSARTERGDGADSTGETKGPVKLDKNLGLDERLQELDIDAAHYKTLLKSQTKVQEEMEANEPETAEEAASRWKKLKNTPDHLGLLSMYKRAGIEPIKLANERGIKLPGEAPPLDPKTQEALDAIRVPINVRAVHLRPLRRAPTHGIPVCDFQLRSYSIRNLEFFADFALRVAYYMGLATRGPIPLPRITERWTVPRSNFIFKKSQENFERITMRRLIQIQDGHPDVVKAWLAFLQKHQYHGVGMKANIWEYESLDAATNVGAAIKKGDFKGRKEGPMLEKVQEILAGPGFKEAMKDYKGPLELK